MEIDFLRHYGLDKNVTDLLRKNYGDNLLSVQEAALVSNNLFDGTNMVICAPTSSGKTLIGEVGALFHVYRDRRSIFLVPTKSLAYEKFLYLREVYGSLGIRVVLSSRDHREFDESIVFGRYQIAVVVYEKLLNLLVQNSGILESVGLVILDELQTLFDPERGARIEELITHLRRASKIQLVGLSAVLDGSRLARWLRAKLVEESRRPTDLRQGVLCRGRFHYKEYNSGQEGVEELFHSDSEEEKEILLEAATFFAEKGEQTLIFVPGRDMTLRWAQDLYERVDLPPATEALATLEDLEPNTAGQHLKHLLGKGIAVHSSDLTWSQRELVERGLLTGEIRVAVTTSTLSEGVNMPVVNTLVCRQSYRSTVDSRLCGRPPQLVRLAREEFQNMTGRSGRVGKSAFGRGMTAVGYEGEIRGVLSRYLTGAWEHPEPILKQSRLESTVLGLVAARIAVCEEDLRSFAEDTLSFQEGGSDWIEQRFYAALRMLIASSLIRVEGKRLECSAVGTLLAQYGLDIESGIWFLDWLKEEPERGYSEMELLLIVSLCQDAVRSYFPFFEREWKNHIFLRRLWQVLEREGGQESPFVAKMLGGFEAPTFEQSRGIKRAIFLHDWCSEMVTEELESAYFVLEGMACRIGEEAAWLLQAFSDLARLKMASESTIQTASSLVLRAGLGLPFAWRSFGSLDITGLTRDMLKRLALDGIGDLATLKSAPESRIRQVLPTSVAERVLQWRSKP